VGAELFHVDRRKDGQTDMRKLTVAFHTFANAPVNEDVCVRLCRSQAVNPGVKLRSYIHSNGNIKCRKK